MEKQKRQLIESIIINWPGDKKELMINYLRDCKTLDEIEYVLIIAQMASGAYQKGYNDGREINI